jgi:hypothetical protein
VTPSESCVLQVHSFHELATTPLAHGVNALCWERSLPGDYAEVVRLLGDGGGEAITTLDEAILLALPLSPAGRVAAEHMLADLRLLRDHDLDPVLNCIHGYPRDEEPGPIKTDVFSYHADSANTVADTWLCSYTQASSEGLRQEDAILCADIPETRATLLQRYGGADDDGFRAYLTDNFYDLHYVARPGARPFSFGLGNLWRITTDYPGSPVPPCVHRAPATLPGQPPRLLLIS